MRATMHDCAQLCVFRRNMCVIANYFTVIDICVVRIYTIATADDIAKPILHGRGEGE